jgi:AraC family transcriptional regulator
MKLLSTNRVFTSRGIEVEWKEVEWEEPGDTLYYVEDACVVNVAVTPRPRNSRGRYEGAVRFQQFQPLGKILFLPHGVPMHGLGERGTQTMLRMVFNPSVLGIHEGWTRRQLEGGLDLSGREVQASCKRILMEVVEPGFAGLSAIEASCHLLAVDLARQFRAGETGKGRSRGGLGPVRLRKIAERLAMPGPSPTVAELATACQMTRRHLYRCFIQEFGVSPVVYIANWRMERACDALMNGRKQIKQIAFDLGFPNAPAFTTAFRNRTGTTPSIFRRQALR